jgi:hypothetical protein
VSGRVAAPPSEDLAPRPRLRRGLVAAPMRDGLLIEGGPSRQLLTGAASSLLPRLLPLLDGQRTVEEISTELSRDRLQFDQVLRFLSQRALLEWVRPGGPPSFAAAHVGTYMSRTLCVTEGHQSADDCAGELASATVLLAAPPALAEPIAADLSETGIGTVTLIESARVTDALSGTTGCRIVAVFDDQAQPQALEEIAWACRERGLPVLRFGGTASTAEIGPIFYGLDTACVSCFRRGQVTIREDWHEPASDDVGRMLPGLVTAAALAMVLGQGPAVPPRRLLRINLPSMLTDSYDVIPDLECGHCVGGTPPSDVIARELLAYEWRTGKWPAFLTPGKALSPAEKQRLTALQRERDGLPSSPHHRLPDQIDVPAPDAVAYPRCLDEPVLAGILARVAGFRPATVPPGTTPPDSRWMPTGGNLASVTSYLIAESDPFGLPGTIFRYDDIGHQVASVHADHVPVAQILAGTGLEAANTGHVIVLTAALRRLRKKYHGFTWRLVHLDAGCAAMQLRTVAGGYGMRVTFAATWPAQLGQMLELDPRREIVTAVAAISTL